MTPRYQHEESLDYYFKDLEKLPPLKRGEEEELAKRAKAGDKEAQNRIVEANLRFVVSECKRYRNQGVPFQDLIQQGNWGLLEAIKRFDPERGVKFITYAVHWVKLKVLECLYEEQGHVDAKRQIEEVAGAIDFLEDLLHSDRPLSAEEEVVAVEFKEEISRLIDNLLEPREAEIVKHYYGLDGFEPKTLMELQDIFRVSYERIRQVKERALITLGDGIKAITEAEEAAREKNQSVS